MIGLDWIGLNSFLEKKEAAFLLVEQRKEAVAHSNLVLVNLNVFGLYSSLLSLSIHFDSDLFSNRLICIHTYPVSSIASILAFLQNLSMCLCITLFSRSAPRSRNTATVGIRF